jgi:peptide-methionine (R)-S-oxide reductase
MKIAGAVILGLFALVLWARPWSGGVPGRVGVPMGGKKVVQSDGEWRRQLTPEQYRVTRRKGTERAFTGPYWNAKVPGTYRCVCCGQPLFSSDAKFDSGTGWPSFWKPVDPDRVSLHEDRGRLWLWRVTEVTCSRCDAHLGHVFADGPRPTGLRYCINGTALELVPQEEGNHETHEGHEKEDKR